MLAVSSDLENSGRRDAVRQQVIESCSHLQQPGGRALRQYFVGRDGDEGFPVWRRNRCFSGDFLTAQQNFSTSPASHNSNHIEDILLRVDCLEHKQRSS